VHRLMKFLLLGVLGDHPCHEGVHSASHWCFSFSTQPSSSMGLAFTSGCVFNP
jgi:hypothetical protein